MIRTAERGQRKKSLESKKVYNRKHEELVVTVTLPGTPSPPSKETSVESFQYQIVNNDSSTSFYNLIFYNLNTDFVGFSLILHTYISLVFPRLKENTNIKRWLVSKSRWSKWIKSGSDQG